MNAEPLTSHDCLEGEVISPPEFQVLTLQRQNQVLKQKVLDLSSQNRLALQLCEALGDHNRYFASEAVGHTASDNEAFLHYVSYGGKDAFDKTHPQG